MSSVVDRILESIAWFAGLAVDHPDLFLLFFEDDSAAAICDGFVRVLGIDDDREWRAAAQIALDVNGQRYDHGRELHDAFRASVERYFTDAPDVADHLMALAGGPGASPD